MRENLSARKFLIFAQTECEISTNKVEISRDFLGVIYPSMMMMMMAMLRGDCEVSVSIFKIEF